MWKTNVASLILKSYPRPAFEETMGLSGLCNSVLFVPFLFSFLDRFSVRLCHTDSILWYIEILKKIKPHGIRNKGQQRYIFLTDTSFPSVLLISVWALDLRTRTSASFNAPLLLLLSNFWFSQMMERIKTGLYEDSSCVKYLKTKYNCKN